MSNEPKFCKDCKHFKKYELIAGPFGSIGGEGNCEHPSLVNVVYGNRLSVDASTRRHPNSTTGCGYLGLQFEAGERTQGLMQPILDIQKKAIESVDRLHEAMRAKRIEQHIHPQPRSWWEFWK